MTFLLKHRYSVVDLIVMSFAANAAGSGHLWVGVSILTIGSAVSCLLEAKFKP